MNGTDFSVLFLEYIGLSVLLFAVLVAVMIACITTAYRLFEKMGLRPWIGLVPFLNIYLLFAKTKIRRLYIPWLILLFSTLVLLGAVLAYPSPSPLLLIAVCPSALSFFLVSFKLARRLASAFERSAFYALLITLVPPLFLPFIAFSTDQYFEKTY